MNHDTDIFYFHADAENCNRASTNTYSFIDPRVSAPSGHSHWKDTNSVFSRYSNERATSRRNSVIFSTELESIHLASLTHNVYDMATNGIEGDEALDADNLPEDLSYLLNSAVAQDALASAEEQVYPNSSSTSFISEAKLRGNDHGAVADNEEADECIGFAADAGSRIVVVKRNNADGGSGSYVAPDKSLLAPYGNHLVKSIRPKQLSENSAAPNHFDAVTTRTKALHPTGSQRMKLKALKPSFSPSTPANGYGSGSSSITTDNKPKTVSVTVKTKIEFFESQKATKAASKKDG